LLTKSEQADSNSKSYITVRFGNVANSSGSVFTIWKKQLMNLEKLTITDPNATRYLMSISEAVNLVLDASILGKGGEVFVLDMGKPYKIIELLKFFLDNYNLKIKDPHNPQGINYKVIGLRKGEKKDESLFYNKNYVKTHNNYIYNSNETLVANKLEINKILNQIQNSKGNISSKLIDKMFRTLKKNDL
jgi:FlaA1/EpsC-like NDP-sugar epimerase